MKLYALETGNFKLDGGAMFGVVPKVLWGKAYPADENNLCTWAMRSLLADDGERRILIDNGIGDTLDEKFLRHFYLSGDDNLEKSMASAGYEAKDITDVVITHLHFDHCGGNVKRVNGNLVPSFPNARYWVSRMQFDNAMNPNEREKASFMDHLILPVMENNQLHFIEKEGEMFPGFTVKLYHGHTLGQVVPHIAFNGRTVVYAADLLPSAAHVPMSWVMAYDMEPTLTLQEKEDFFRKAVAEQYIIFLEHDIYNECITLQDTPKGVRMKESFRLKDLTGQPEQL